MTSGQTSDFLPVFGEHTPMLTMQDIARTFDRIELTGTMRDAMGQVHPVDDSLTNLAEWQRLNADALISWEQPRPEKRWAKEFGEAMNRPTTQIVQALKSISRELNGDKE